VFKAAFRPALLSPPASAHPGRGGSQAARSVTAVTCRRTATAAACRVRHRMVVGRPALRRGRSRWPLQPRDNAEHVPCPARRAACPSGSVWDELLAWHSVLRLTGPNRNGSYNGQRELAPSACAATSSLAMPWLGPSCAAARSMAAQSNRPCRWRGPNAPQAARKTAHLGQARAATCLRPAPPVQCPSGRDRCWHRF
jgi:hypothetical protein